MSTQTQPKADIIEIRRFLGVVVTPGKWTELRVLKTGATKTVSGYFDSEHLDVMAQAAEAWNGKAVGVYLTLNPVNPALSARSENRAKPYAEFATADADIIRREWLLIDFDAVRPSGISSTNAEHEAAIERTKQAREYLIMAGFSPNSIIPADSGNGGHLLIRIYLANDAESTSLCQRVLQALDLKFSDGAVTVDQTPSNAGRVCKIYGTHVCKGDNTTERPHRMARILDLPETIVPASRELLTQLAATVPVRPSAAPTNGHHVDLPAWLAKYNVAVHHSKPWNGGALFVLAECPWNPEHNHGEAFAIQWDSGAIDAGCHHNSCAQFKWEDLREKYEPKAGRKEHGKRDERPLDTVDTGALPEIILTGKHLREQTAEALTGLNQSNNPPHLFRRSGALTRIGIDEKGLPYTETLTESALRGKLARAANFVRIDEKGISRPIAPPLDVTRDIYSLGAWDFPALESITESPALRQDGTILNTPGYDAQTRLYYAPAPGIKVPAVPETPTESELKPAIDLVLEVLCDFPFDTPASRANGYGALIAPVLRPAINGPAPLPTIDKPQAGTGASLMADVISIIATGHLAATMGVPHSEEEWEKKLSSHLLAGRSLCVIDNIEGKLYSDTLSRYLTSTHVSIRPLGRSADIILANNMTFLATGNNIRLGGDMPRRCFWIRLDAGVARPWLREMKFKHPDLREWVFDDRGSILAAILIIARGWITAGRPVPEGLPTLGGFESYCRTIGGVLAFMGVTGFMGNLMSMYEKMDADTPQWESFLEQWREAIGETAVTVADLIKKLNSDDDLAATLPDAIATRDGRDYSRRLGNTLAKRAGVQLPNGLTVVKAGTARTRAIAWAVLSYRNANSAPFSFNAELAESKNTPAHKESNGTPIYSHGAAINSHNSAADSKLAELTPRDTADLDEIPLNSDDLPPLPEIPCPCGGDEWQYSSGDPPKVVCGKCGKVVSQ